MKMDLIRLFINNSPFDDASIKKFLIDIIVHEVDPKDFSLYDPEKKEWWQNESDNDNSEAITRVQDLFMHKDLMRLIADVTSDFVADLPKPFLYQWMVQEEWLIDRLLKGEELQYLAVFESLYLFKSRFKSCERIKEWSLCDLATSSMEYYMFFQVCSLIESNWDYLAEYFGEKNWYESEMYQSTLEPPITCLADVGMSQKDFL